MEDTESRRQEDLSLIHPVKDQPLDDQERGRLEQRAERAYDRRRSFGEDAHNPSEGDEGPAHIYSDRVHADHDEWKRPLAVAAHVNDHIKNQEEQASPTRGCEAVGSSP